MTPDPAACTITRAGADHAVHHLGHGVAVHRPQGDPHPLVDVASSVHSTNKAHRQGTQEQDERHARQHFVYKVFPARSFGETETDDTTNVSIVMERRKQKNYLVSGFLYSDKARLADSVQFSSPKPSLSVSPML